MNDKREPAVAVCNENDDALRRILLVRILTHLMPALKIFFLRMQGRCEFRKILLNDKMNGLLKKFQVFLPFQSFIYKFSKNQTKFNFPKSKN